MSQLDKAKEFINMLKVYLGIIVALLISVVSGTARLFNSNTIETTFWLGIATIFVLSYLFIRLAKYIHQKIDELEDM